MHALNAPKDNPYRIFALDVSTGHLVWQKQTSATIESSISVVNGVLFFGSDDNKIYALDATNGDELWSYQTDFYVRTFPAIAGGKVIIASHDKRLYAFQLP
jgi:outer membrane protein assembly factor BamB